MENCSDSSSDEFASDNEDITDKDKPAKSLLSQFILHLDVDCFYCQCEELSNPSLAKKPFAIGQKHIIVTSNYIARSMGVKKLQGRKEALKTCKDLIIIEGSDLEPYRDASRRIYTAFRESVKNLHEDCAAKKGGMDESFADISVAVNILFEKGKMNDNLTLTDDADFWIYGEDRDSSVAVIREDQSGATSRSICKSDDINAEEWGSKELRKECTVKFHIASRMAKSIQDQVKAVTGFSTTLGISVSPMLAKLATDLKKPKSVNVLYPWRSKAMIENMPLRRIPELGSRTLRSIIPILEQHNSEKDSDWTCLDLVSIPRHALKGCIDNEEKIDLLISRCRGIDTVPIADDNGGLAKTVSVEDSFIRGSLTSMEGVIENLEILFVRLLRLLDKRKDISHYPQAAYPRAIRLTARIVDRSVTSRRPFRNVSRQASFNGKAVMESHDRDERVSMLKRNTMPLLQILRNVTVGLNVTRLNLATVSFADIDTTSQQKNCHEKKKEKKVSCYFEAQKMPSKGKESTKEDLLVSVKVQGIAEDNNDLSSKPKSMQDVIAILRRKQYRKKSRPRKRKHETGSHSEGISNSLSDQKKNSQQDFVELHESLDHSVFDALPADVAQEVLANQEYHLNPSKKKVTIQSFFVQK